jgi:hypothetical protein
MHELNRSRKHGSATMLCVIVGVLVFFLSYALVKAVHHVDPNAQPNPPMHDQR